MRVNRLLAAGLLVTGLLGALPSNATETAATTTPAAVAPLADLGLFTPAPIDRIGTTGGPCNASVTCRNGKTLTCHGLGSCQWKGDGIPSLPGFVQCDGVRQTCTPP
jgi:hypothetical protein